MTRPRRGGARRGYALIMLLIVVSTLSIALTAALPVYRTELRREKEAELIHRGKQFVEAVRLYQLRNPGRYPSSIEDLVEEKCLRRPFTDPMTPDGAWNVILLPASPAGMTGGLGGQPGSPGAGSPAMGARAALGGGGGGGAVQQVLVAPAAAVESMGNPQILGVVSPSTEKSFRIYNDQESYDKWLFFYGQNPKAMPKIVYYGASEAR